MHVAVPRVSSGRKRDDSTAPPAEGTKGSALVSRMLDRLVTFAQRGVIRSIGVLVGGAVIAHGITLLAMPINTRLYSPEDFTVLSVFSSLTLILTPIACLRFDAAIVMPASEDDAVNLFVVALLADAVVSVSLAVVMLLLPSSAYRLLNVSALLPYLWLIPPTVFIAGAYLALQAWYLRQKGFGAIARSRAGQATAAASSQIGLGYAGVVPLGLILGHALNYGVGSIALFGGMLVRHRGVLGAVKWSRMTAVFRTYERFPRYSVWEALANGLSNSAPLVIIAAMATGPEAGFLTLSLFVLQAPLALLGNAIGQVYLSGAPQAHREGRLDTYTAETLAGLTRAGSGPLVFAAIASPALFGLIFGESWERSGVLVTWMAPWFLLQFLASPICNALHVSGHQKTMMNFHLIGVVVRVGGVLIAGMVAKDVISEVWAVSGWFFYAAYLLTILHVVGLPKLTVVNGFRRAAPSIALGLVAGLLAVGAAWLFDLSTSGRFAGL